MGRSTATLTVNRTVADFAFDVDTPPPRRNGRRGAFTTRDGAAAWVRRWCGRLDTLDWSGRGGATDRCVAEALARCANENGGPRFTGSVSTIALYAGIHRHTALVSLRRLERRGLVRRIDIGGNSRAARWLLLMPRTEAHAAAGRDSETWVGEDWARHGALSKAGALVLRAARDGARSRSELAQRSGLSERTVRRQLRRLAALGVVDTHGVPVDVDLDDVAEALGTSGAGKRAREAIERSRELRHERQGRRHRHGAQGHPSTGRPASRPVATRQHPSLSASERVVWSGDGAAGASTHSK